MNPRTTQSQHKRKVAIFAWLLLLFALPGLAYGEPKDEPKPSSIVPKGAWVLESVSVAVAGIGFVVLAIGATTLGRRDQIISDFENPSGFNTNPTRPDAKEIRDLQNTGYPLVITGLIVAGVGVAGMLAGGIWILAHRPKGSTETKSSTKVSRTTPGNQTTPPQARLLLQTP